MSEKHDRLYMPVKPSAGPTTVKVFYIDKEEPPALEGAERQEMIVRRLKEAIHALNGGYRMLGYDDYERAKELSELNRARKYLRRLLKQYASPSEG